LSRWVKEIRRANNRKEELENKLSFYESQLTAYRAVAYDGIRSESFGNKVENNLIFVINKINEATNELDRHLKMINEYKNLLRELNNKQRLLMEYLVETNLNKTEIAFRMNISRNRVYAIARKLNLVIASFFIVV
jgi:DNA-directed RNA polymerase specialized sigma subunit